MRSGGPELGGVFHVMRCIAGNWQAGSGSDTTPDAFYFIHQTDVALSTQITSNSITITGIDAAAPVSVSGQGSPQIRINGGAWATSGTIENGQTLEVRLTSSATNSTTHSAIVDVGGVSPQWNVTTAAPAGPTGCPNIGDVCTDGSIFAGDTNMYVADSHQSIAIEWSNETVNNMGARSNSDGAANQAWIVANRTLSQYPAFELCENLFRHGHSDWYFPSRNELYHLYTNKDAIGGFISAWYWSSTERNNSNAWAQRFTQDDRRQGGRGRHPEQSLTGPETPARQRSLRSTSPGRMLLLETEALQEGRKPVRENRHALSGHRHNRGNRPMDKVTVHTT